MGVSPKTSAYTPSPYTNLHRGWCQRGAVACESGRRNNNHLNSQARESGGWGAHDGFGCCGSNSQAAVRHLFPGHRHACCTHCRSTELAQARLHRTRRAIERNLEACASNDKLQRATADCTWQLRMHGD